MSPLPGPSLRGRASHSKPESYSDSPGPAAYDATPKPKVEAYMTSTAVSFTTQTRFPTTDKNVPLAYMGSLKTYPVEPNAMIPFKM